MAVLQEQGHRRKTGCTNVLQMEEGTSCFASRMRRRKDKTVTVSDDRLGEGS